MIEKKKFRVKDKYTRRKKIKGYIDIYISLKWADGLKNRLYGTIDYKKIEKIPDFRDIIIIKKKKHLNPYDPIIVLFSSNS